MASTVLLVQGSASINSIVARNFCCGNVPFDQAQNTEAIAQTTWRAAGTFSGLRAKITTAGTAGSLLQFRVDGANGNQVLNVGATGEYTTVSTDTITATQKVNYKFTAIDAGGIIIEDVRIVFAADANTVMRSMMTDMGDNNPLPASSTTSFHAIAGIGFGQNTTEANHQFRVGGAGTFGNMFIYSTNGSPCTATFRVAGANTAITVTVAASGITEDTAHTAVVAQGDLVNYSIATDATVGTRRISQLGVTFTSTDGGQYAVSSVSPNGQVINANTTTYLGLSDLLATLEQTTEADRGIDLGLACTIARLYAYVSANGVTATSTLTSRKNQAAGTMSGTLASSTTGAIEDTSNSDTSLVSTDEYNLRLVTGATGTSLTLNTYGVWITNTAAGGATATLWARGMI